MNIKRAALLLVNLIFANFIITGQNLTNENFQIHQKIDVSFKDGNTIQLTDYIFYAKHAKPEVWWGNETLAKTTYLMIYKGDYWQTIRIEDIKTIEFFPITDNHKWENVMIALSGGDTLTGKIPLKPNLTWVNGDEFRFSGAEKINKNGKKDFRLRDMGLFEVKSITRTIENDILIKEKSGKEYLFDANLKFITYGQNKMQTYRYSTISHIGTTIRIKMNKMEKALDINDMRTIFFEEDGNVLRIIMKDATELKGKRIQSIYNLFGKMGPDKIWFGAIKENIKSINFIED